MVDPLGKSYLPKIVSHEVRFSTLNPFNKFLNFLAFSQTDLGEIALAVWNLDLIYEGYRFAFLLASRSIEI
jgi:hypothetical protein